MSYTIKDLPCGFKAFASMNVDHDEVLPVLNRCECGREITKWSIGGGHQCDCGKRCNGKCRGQAA